MSIMRSTPCWMIFRNHRLPHRYLCGIGSDLLIGAAEFLDDSMGWDAIELWIDWPKA